MRKMPFANNEFYHVYNRGTDKRKIFLDSNDYQRFLLSMELMNDERDGLMIAWRDYKSVSSKADVDAFLRYYLRKRQPLVEIVCFSLLPNHFHFILKQIHDRGIGEFMRRIGIGYTRYFNERRERNGVLFQGGIKSTHIKSTHHLLYLSAYVNCNSEIHGISRAGTYRWSSFPEYIGKTRKGLCGKGKKAILDNFRSGDDYKNYAYENAKHFQEKKLDERLDEKMLLE
jgi:putative transposase